MSETEPNINDEQLPLEKTQSIANQDAELKNDQVAKLDENFTVSSGLYDSSKGTEEHFTEQDQSSHLIVEQTEIMITEDMIEGLDLQ